jgi:CRP/FNR family transcriptional regulator, cyclic AMP receptor protein
MELNLLEDLSARERDALLAKCMPRRFARRQALFHFGDPSNGMYVVAKGRVVVRISTPTGEEASLTVIGPGQSVGEQSLLVEGGRRSASAVALEPVETLFLSRQAFLELRAEDAGFDQVMLRILAARVVRLTDQLIEALFVPATTRVLRRVIDAAALYGDGTIPLTQEELAAMAGSTRNTANRVLRAAQDAALLEVKRGRITVLDMRGLRRLADAG